MTKLETSASWSLHSGDMNLFNSFHTNFSLCGYYSHYNGMLLFCLRRIGLLHRVLVAIAEKQKVHDRLLWKRKDSYWQSANICHHIFKGMWQRTGSLLWKLAGCNWTVNCNLIVPVPICVLAKFMAA